MKITQVSGEHHLLGILELQAANHKTVVNDQVKREQGFVTVKHNLIQLKQLMTYAPQIIAVDEDDTVVGYALVMVKELRNAIPTLVPLFDVIEQLSFEGKPISEQSWYVMGQVCVAHDYRSKGVFRQLYAAHKALLKEQFDLCITDISKSNTRSIAAHQAVGFELLYTFTDDQDDWEVVVLKLH